MTTIDIDLIKKHVASLLEHERMDFLYKIMEGYCIRCGGPLTSRGRCYCEADD